MSTFLSQGYNGQKNFTIPSLFDTVGPEALKDCLQLERLVIPGTVKKIEHCAFENCVNLQEVVLEEGIEELGRYLFTGCEKLHQITVPDSVKRVTPDSFHRIPNLNLPVLNASGTEYIYCPPKLGEKKVTIPHGVRIIQRQAFDDFSALEEVILPNTLERIEWSAFQYTSLKRVTLPESVKYVSGSSFCGCGSLEQVDIRCDSTAIQPFAFAECPCLRLPYASPSQYIECMQMQGKSLFRFPEKRELPGDGHEADPRFLECAAGCLMGKQEAMEQMADYFHGKQEDGHPFYLLAEHFWRMRLYYLGNQKAKQWFFDWITAHPDTQMEVAAPVPVPRGDGAVLHALGFLFFDPHRYYYVQNPDDCGIVEVSAYAESSDPDDDGFGSENYYDWWYMTENLAMVPGSGCAHSYSNLDRNSNEQRFEALHDSAAETWKNHPELVEQGIYAEIEESSK